jgi:hypothetical protein
LLVFLCLFIYFCFCVNSFLLLCLNFDRFLFKKEKNLFLIFLCLLVFRFVSLCFQVKSRLTRAYSLASSSMSPRELVMAGDVTFRFISRRICPCYFNLGLCVDHFLLIICLSVWLFLCLFCLFFISGRFRVLVVICHDIFVFCFLFSFFLPCFFLVAA